MDVRSRDQCFVPDDKSELPQGSKGQWTEGPRVSRDTRVCKAHLCRCRKTWWTSLRSLFFHCCSFLKGTEQVQRGSCSQWRKDHLRFMLFWRFALAFPVGQITQRKPGRQVWSGVSAQTEHSQQTLYPRPFRSFLAKKFMTGSCQLGHTLETCRPGYTSSLRLWYS